MAEPIIGLRIQLNGIDSVVNDVKTLETELRKAKEDLTEIGINFGVNSENFKKLKNEVVETEGKLNKVKTAVQGISPEKSIEGFSKLGAGISSGFAAATAAVSLFGSKSESVQKAAADAQNLLTIALSIRGLAEVRTGALIVAKTITEKASTLATNAANAATKAFYTTLAANPFGVILAVVGLLVGAYFALAGATDEADNAQERFNKTLEESNKQFDLERTNIENALAIKLKLAEKEGASIQKLSAIREQYYVDLLDIQDKQVKALIGFDIRRQREIDASNLSEVEKEKQKNELKIQTQKEYDRLQQIRLKLETDRTLNSIDLQIKEAEAQKKLSAERRALLEKDIELYTAILDLQAKSRAESYKLGEVDAKVVETAKARVASLEALRAKLVETLPFEEQFALKLKSTFSLVSDEAGRGFTRLIAQFEKFSNEAVNTAKSTEDLKYQLQALPTLAAGFKDFFKDSISEDTAKQIDKLASNYEQLSVILFDISKTNIKPPFDIPAFKKAFKDLSDLQNEVVIFGPDAALIKQNAENQKKEFIRAYVELQNATKEGEEKLKAIRNSPDFADEPSREAAIKKLQDGYVKAGETFFEGLKSNILEIEKFNNGVGTTAAKVEELNQQIVELKNNSELFGAFLLENRDLFANAYDVDLTKLAENRERADKIISEVGKKTYDKEKKFQQDVLDFETKLKQKGVDISKLTYEQKLELLKDALAKEIVEVETAEAKKEKAQKKTIDNVTKALQQFSQLVGQTAALYAQYYQFQLKQLENTSKAAQEQVVGDTEQANQKRIELEKQYQLQKAEIEKRALIKSLQFQLVQAIVDTAQAVVANLEIPPLAIAVGILGAVQVGLIAQQLAYAQSLAGGGKIRMGAGGMVVGPSHEMGGVSYAGGYNLEGGESVINRQSSLNYAGLLSQINQSGGGQPIVNNASNSLMEERLIQAISRANQEPIRAYVLNSEITSGQAINRRLNELATL
jgi:hypothetical protein